LSILGKILQISDSHLFSDPNQKFWGCNPFEQLQAIRNYILAADFKPDILFLTGDLANDYSTGAYLNLLRIIAPLNIETYCLPGNHDSRRRMRKILAKNFKFADTLSWPNWRIILLDSTMILNRLGLPHGYLSSSQMDFINSQIKQAAETNIMLVLHHHPVLVGSKFIDKLALINREKLCSLLYKHFEKKILVLFGHVHQEFESMINNVVFLGCPAASVQFLPNVDNLKIDTIAPGFRWLELNENGFKTEVFRILMQ
jgi:Icc protein